MAVIALKRAVCRVFINGRELLTHHGARVKLALDADMGDAEVRCPLGVPEWVTLWSTVVIEMGNQASSANVATRFSGILIDDGRQSWPATTTLKCKGLLYRASITMAPSTGLTLANLTDTEIVTKLLLTSGIADGQMSIQGVGATMGTTVPTGDTRYEWKADSTALVPIQEVDKIALGYRTIDGLGLVVRRKVSVIPRSAAAASYSYGVDLFDTGANSVVKAPRNRVQVVAWTGTTLASVTDLSNPVNGQNTLTVLSPLIEDLTSGGVGITAEDIGDYWLAESQWWLMRVRWSTWRDELLTPGDTVEGLAEPLGYNQNFIVQGVEYDVSEAGAWTMTLTCVSQLGLGSANRKISSTVLGPSTAGTGFSTGPGTSTAVGSSALPIGTPVTPPVPTLPPPSNTDVSAAFSVRIVEKERVVVGGVATTVYTIYAEAQATSRSGTIASYAWTLSGGTPHGPTTGDLKIFVSSVEALSTATLRLVVVDSNGGTADSGAKSLSNGAGAALMVRELFLAAKGKAEALDPLAFVWNQDGSTGNITLVGNGPFWGGDTQARVMRSTDYLATGALESSPAWPGGAYTTALWNEPDVSTTAVVVGGSTGDIALSTDAAATWVVKRGPASTPVVRVIASRFVRDQIQYGSTSGYWVSDNAGDGWRLISTAHIRDMALAPGRNGFILSSGAVVCIDAAGVQTVQTGPSTTAIAIAADVRENRFVVLTEDGESWRTSSNGSNSMVQRQNVPGGVPQIRGLYRDGLIPTLYYYAAGGGSTSAGAWKTLDAFLSTSGFLHLRQPGVDGAESTGVWSQVGVGLLVPSATAPVASGVTSLIFGVEYDSGATPGEGGGNAHRRSSTGTWSKPTSGITDTVFVKRLCGTPDNGSRAYAVVSDDDTTMQFLTSADGGATWTEMTWPAAAEPGDLNNDYSQHIVSPADGTCFIAIGNSSADRGIWKTTDHGASWTRVITFPAGTIRCGGMDVTATHLWYSRFVEGAGAASSAYYANLDGSGETAIPTITASVFNPPCQMRAVDDDTVLVVTQLATALYRWSIGDVSATNIDIAGNTGSIIEAVAVDGSTFVALAYLDSTLGLYRTTNAGSSWAMVQKFDGGFSFFPDESTTGTDDSFSRKLDVLKSDRTRVYCYGTRGRALPDDSDSNTQFYIWVSTDGGATWVREDVTSGVPPDTTSDDFPITFVWDMAALG